MSTIKRWGKELFHRDAETRYQAFISLMKARKHVITKSEATYLIRLLHQKEPVSRGDWDHPHQAILLFLKHHPHIVIEEPLIDLYESRTPEEQSYILEVLLKLESPLAYEAFFHYFSRDFKALPSVELFPLLQQLSQIERYFHYLLPVFEEKRYQSILFHLFCEARKEGLLKNMYKNELKSVISRYYPELAERYLEYNDDYTPQFANGPWAETYSPLQQKIKSFLRAMGWIRADVFVPLLQNASTWNDPVLRSEAAISLYVMTNEFVEAPFKHIKHHFEGVINTYSAIIAHRCDHLFEKIDISIQDLTIAHLIYRLHHLERIPLASLHVSFMRHEIHDCKRYDLYSFYSTDADWDDKGTLYGISGPYELEQHSLYRMTDTQTHLFLEPLTETELVAELDMIHSQIQNTKEEWLGEFRFQLPKIYLPTLIIAFAIFVIQLLDIQNVWVTISYGVFLAILTYLTFQRIDLNKRFVFSFSNQRLYYRCGEIDYELPIKQISFVKEEVRETRLEENRFLRHKKDLFIVFYDQDGKEALSVPTALVEKPYIKKFLRQSNIKKIDF